MIEEMPASVHPENLDKICAQLTADLMVSRLPSSPALINPVVGIAARPKNALPICSSIGRAINPR